MESCVTHRFIHMLRVPKERTLAPSLSLYPATTWSSEQHLSLTVRFVCGCWSFLRVILWRRPFSSLKFATSLQVAAGWMPWSWLLAAPVSTSWQPKVGEKQILARLQSPPIYSTCCSLPDSVIQSCYSKHYTHTFISSLRLLVYVIGWSVFPVFMLPNCHICQFKHKTLGHFFHQTQLCCLIYAVVRNSQMAYLKCRFCDFQLIITAEEAWTWTTRDMFCWMQNSGSQCKRQSLLC